MMSTAPALVFLGPGEGKTVPIGRLGFSFKAGSRVGSSYAVIEATMQVGARNSLHRHANEETMYVVEGEVEAFGEGGARRILGPGDVMHVPSGAVHGFVVVGETPARMLVICPADREAYFDDLSAAMARAKDDPDAVVNTDARHGVERVGSVAGGR